MRRKTTSLWRSIASILCSAYILGSFYFPVTESFCCGSSFRNRAIAVPPSRSSSSIVRLTTKNLLTTRTSSVVDNSYFPYTPLSKARTIHQLQLQATISSPSNDNNELDNQSTINNLTKITQLQIFQSITKEWTNFKFGFEYVNSQYLDLFLDLCIKKTMVIFIPLSLAVYLGKYYLNLYNILSKLLQLTFLVSSFIGGILQFPLSALKYIWHIFPSVTISMIESNYLPNFLAVRLTEIMLFFQYELPGISQSYLFSLLAIYFWRPLIEEIQYRYMLFRLLGQERPQREQEDEYTFASSPLEDEEGSPSSNTDETKQQEESSSSSSSIASFIQFEDSENSTIPTNTTNTGTDTLSSLPPTTTTALSRRVNLGSILFATTRLGWLCALPDQGLGRRVFVPSVWSWGFLQSATAPYVWTVGFMQSALTHMSSSVLSELAPLLHGCLLLLTLHQVISTYYLARHVLAPLYETKGLSASIGAHIAWTIGKTTLPFQILYKCLLSASSASFFEQQPKGTKSTTSYYF